MDPRDVLRTLAEQQHGYVLRWDARAAGLSAKALRSDVTRGEWEVQGPRVLRRAGAPVSKASRLMLACLDAGPGAFLSHGPAAAWWGIPGYDLLTLHVTRPRGVCGHRPRFTHQLHEVLDLTTRQVTVLDGIPIVRPERLCFELFATSHPMRATRATETAWSKRLLSGRSLRSVWGELFGQGRGGTVDAREFLESHPIDWVPPDSNNESRFHDLMTQFRIGPWRRQVDIGDDAWVGRVDYLAEDRPLVVEIQSERYHRALLDAAADAERIARLEATGFVVVEVWDTELWHHKDVVRRKVLDGWRRAGRLVGATPGSCHHFVP